MNAVGELGNLIVQYQRIIEIALLSIFGIMILFFVIRAFVRAKKKKNVLDDISHTVENISETVSEIKEKQDCLKADFHRENMSSASGNTVVTPENCEISKRIMQECDKIDSYMADLAARMNIKEEHIEKLQQIQIDQFVRNNHNDDEGIELESQTPTNQIKSGHEEFLKDSAETVSTESHRAIEESNPNLYEFDVDAIDDELWKEDVQGKHDIEIPHVQCNETAEFAPSEKAMESAPRATVSSVEMTTLEPHRFDDIEQTSSDEEQPLQTVEEILAQCADENQSVDFMKPRAKSRFKENWDDEARPSYTFERPEGTVKQGQYARHAEIIMEEERARERALEEARLAEIERQKEAARQAELEREKEAARLAEIERQKEAARLAEIERQKEAARQVEIEKQKEAARQAELEREKEAARLAELERQKEVARLAELERQREAARKAEIARQKSIEREAIIARQQQGFTEQDYRANEQSGQKQFSQEEAALIEKGAKRFDFTMELPTMDEASLGSGRKQAARDFLNSFGSTLNEGSTMQMSQHINNEFVSEKENNKFVERGDHRQFAEVRENNKFVGKSENPFVEAFDKMAENKSVIEPRMNHEEESVSSMDSGIPPKKYFSTDCATDKFGKSYTEEELKNQIN